jgi:hypothetical protein
MSTWTPFEVPDSSSPVQSNMTLVTHPRSTVTVLVYCRTDPKTDFTGSHGINHVQRNVLHTVTASRSSCPIRDLYRPVGLQEVQTTRISAQPAHEGGKTVNSTHLPPLPTKEDPLVLVSVRGRVDPKATVPQPTTRHANPTDVAPYCLHPQPRRLSCIS